MSIWIESESGNLINSDAVREFAVIGPYHIPDMEDEHGKPRNFYDLYAIGVGEVATYHELANGLLSVPFRDAHRYLVQHSSREDCDAVLERLKETLRSGGRYFSAYAFLSRHRAIRQRQEAWARNGRATTFEAAS